MACVRIPSFEDCKDPDSNLPYVFDWTEWVTAEGTNLVDNVANREITISLVDDTETDTTPLTAGTITVDVAEDEIEVWLSGGTEGLKYYVECKVITSDSKTELQTGIITVTDK